VRPCKQEVHGKSLKVVLTDTHCHLDMEVFESDREAVIERAKQAGVQWIIVPSLNLSSSQKVINLVSGYSGLYAAVGVHPNEAYTWNVQSYGGFKNLLGADRVSGGKPSPKIVAIGEIGLDYYWDSSPYPIQKRILIEQLRMATEANLPVILHFREPKESVSEECASDLLNILEKWITDLKSDSHSLAKRPGVLHSFSGTIETATRAMELGFFIGVGGPITYSTATKRQEVIGQIPLERILIETDAPFQTPFPYRGKRNEPAYTRLIADKIGEIHCRSGEQIRKITTQNASRLFFQESRA
jgi:TatD DNase family protein